MHMLITIKKLSTPLCPSMESAKVRKKQGEKRRQTIVYRNLLTQTALWKICVAAPWQI